MNDLDLQRKSLPEEPGVYFFKDVNHKIIYVGKAINLKKRVSSYFLKTTYNDPYYEEKIQMLVEKIYEIEYIVTQNEKEASILENIQIKKNLPFFNVQMRDSKTYPWICIFYSEEFPRIQIIRGPEKYSQKNAFLGPYTDKKEIMRVLRDLRKIFPYCSCKKKVKTKQRPCLYYQLKLCSGPCIGEISREKYLENVTQIELFLKGETDLLKKEIQAKMNLSAEQQNFEAAAFWRDKLEAIEHSTSKQSVLLSDIADKDILGFYTDKLQKYVVLIVIHIREGKIVSKTPITLDLREKIVFKDELFSSLLEQYYLDLKFSLPDVIVIPKIYKGIDLLRAVLKDTKQNIVVRTPSEEEKGLMRIAAKNARVMIEQELQMEEIRKKEGEQTAKALESAKELLNLPKIPRIIEGFDISNIEGGDATGSMVYFLEGKPYNKYYRHFKIKSKSTPDDVAMMKEVLRRRYIMLMENDWELPDLILVDGGKGQLNAGVSVLKELGLEIPIIGLAKKFEEIFLPGEKDPIILPKNSSLLRIFQMVRDEAHRFAVRLHKKQRIKRITRSTLDDINGVGPVTRNKLLKRFGSVEGVKQATIEELTEVVGQKLARLIKENVK
ncbi:MAG: excinuclease ABC subunit UvrC [Candidatus Lokiarchaeota archaeon]|nr:excinuclease ABC subunit UvrC [Candidatus Lokiarchaeota archaeon]